VGYRLAADALLLVHLAFVLFAVFGGFLVFRWPRAALVHLPAAAWAAAVELGGWVCPLTPLEVRFRRMAGGEGYEGGFVENVLLPIVYPEGLEREDQLLLGALVIALNAAIYAVWVGRAVRARR
jgi:hypothetical protein